VTSSNKNANVVPLMGRKCPVCGKAADIEMRPFCSKRCADLDLAKWLDGDYRVPTDEAPSDGAINAGDEEDEHF
jgi:endogenous inhibitor of DNA gyrase (YacG/DUF329 family)